MAVTLKSTGYNTVVDFRWHSGYGYVQISYDAGVSWIDCFGPIPETGLAVVEYFSSALSAWVWVIIYTDENGYLQRKVSADLGVTWV